MPRRKTKQEARAHLEEAIPVIPARYEAGVKVADWHTKAVSDEAEKMFADKMSKVIADKTRQKKIAELTNKDWQDPALTLGAPIIGERIRVKLDKYLKKFGDIYDKVLEDLKTIDIEKPRVVDWRANITNRVVAVVESFKKHAGKL